MSQVNHSLSIVRSKAFQLNVRQKLGLAAAVLGFLIMLVFALNQFSTDATYMLIASLGLMSLGTWLYIRGSYLGKSAGIKNNGVYFNGLISRGIVGWALGILITGFYILLYFEPSLLGQGGDGEANSGLVALFDPLSNWLKGTDASQWFMYGTLYTFAILSLGIKFIYKYRHNRYQVIRTISVMFFQLAFAFLIPAFLEALNKPYYDFKDMWPLNYDFFFDWQLDAFINSGALGLFMLVWGIALILIVSPILTYFFGKRWYCSWVCGCGGLAETAGDPFRHLSDKSLRAWRIERILIYSVLVFAVVMTAAVLYTYFTGSGNILFISSYQLRSAYGFYIGAIFSGVIGVGFYPIMGSRVWCRFGCPMAALLGLQQRFFSRFRITANGSQCISCGNCSAYCEMGIDVRWYAQRGQDIVRASCVGCGICAAVCPRGVLRLENGPGIKERASDIRALHIGEEAVMLEEN